MSLGMPYNFVPDKIVPLTRHIDCPISEEIKVDKYKVLSDGDFTNNIVYLELGYDDKSEYDSSFFIKSSDLKELASQLNKLADTIDSNHRLYKISREWLDGVKNALDQNTIKELYIEPEYIYCTDIHDDLFGTIVFEIGYTKFNSDYISAKILSDSMIMNTGDYLSLQINELHKKYPSLIIEADINKFKKLMKRIHQYKIEQLQPKVEPMKPKATVQDLINGYLQSKGDNNAK